MSAAALAAVVVSVAGCWPVPGQGPDRQAFDELDTAITVANVATLAPLWTAPVGTTGTGDGSLFPLAARGAVVSDAGRVTLSTSLSLEAHDAATGSLVWRNSEAFDGSTQVDPSVFSTGDGRIAFGLEQVDSTVHDSLGIVDAATGGGTPGTVGPQLPVAPGAVRSPWIAGTDTFLDFTGQPLTIDAIAVGRLDQAAPVWTGRIGYNLPSGARSDPTLGTSQLFHAGQGLMVTTPGASTYGNGLRSFALTGTVSNCGAADHPDHACPQWVAPLDGTKATSPVLSPDGATAYVGTDAGTLYAIATADGSVRWHAAVGSAIAHPPALANGTLLVPTASGSLVALAAGGCGATTCTPQWTTATGSALSVQPGASAGGVVVTGATDGTLAAYAIGGCGATTCTPLWTTNLGSQITGDPVLSLGKLFVGTNDGRLIAYAPA